MTSRFKKLLALVAILAALQSAFATASHAQAFGISIGSGGYHHHGGTRWAFGYGYGGYGPWYGPGYGYYGPPPIVYAPQPVVQPVVQPVYIQPQTVTSPAPVPPGPSPYISSGSAPVNAIPVSGSPDDRIVIRNVSNANLPVTFLIDGQDVELADGTTRTFVGKAHRIVQYDRGGRFGSTQQDLTGGQYEFRVNASGWELTRKPGVIPSTGPTGVRSNALPELSASR